MEVKRKAIYIHGLGGSGNGSSAQNVKKMLEDEWSGKYEFSANTYDLLKPEELFEKISTDVKDADFVIASSLGAFYAVSVFICTKMLLLNPCLEPETAIPKILYPEQKNDFDEENRLPHGRKSRKNGSFLTVKTADFVSEFFLTRTSFFHLKMCMKRILELHSEQKISV